MLTAGHRQNDTGIPLYRIIQGIVGGCIACMESKHEIASAPVPFEMIGNITAYKVKLIIAVLIP